MKKLLLIIAALFTIVGCTKTEVVLADAETQEIGLMAINQNSVKATGPISDPSLPTDETMTIWGFYANDGSDYEMTSPYLDKVRYKYQNNAWRGWDGANHKPYYWPSTGSMKFLAVYPNSSGTITRTYASNITTITLSSVDLSIFNNQKDIMYSSNLYETPVTCSYATSKQFLKFEHLLAQVVVAVKPTIANKITITSISIVNAPVKGNLSVGINDDGTSVSCNNSDIITAELLYPFSGLLSTTEYSNSDKGALVIPSSLSDTKLRIKYKIDSGAEITHDINVAGSWEKGKKYIYNVTINLQEIIFDTVVTPWDSQTPVTPSI